MCARTDELTFVRMYKLLLAIGILGFTACSGDDEESPTKTRQMFCEEWGKAACSEETQSVCQAASAEDCIRSQEDFCLDLPLEGYVDERADVCLRAVAAAYADADLDAEELRTVMYLDAPCDQLVRGPKEVGESCTSNLDCDAPGGEQCIIKGTAAGGTCQVPAVVAAGKTCDEAQQVCDVGNYCNGDNCVAFKELGDTCIADAECGPEGLCDQSALGGGTCSPKLDVSAACTENSECKSGVCFQFNDEWRCTTRLRLSSSEPFCDNLR